jgi:LPS sulfotransferase NodH
MATMLRGNRDARRFVVLFPGRSGGTYLVSALNTHPGVVAVPEPLGLRKGQGRRRQVAWIRRHYRGGSAPDAEALGISTKVADLLDPDGFAALMRHHDARVVLLQRANAVKHVVSIMRVRVLKDTIGEWTLTEPHELGPIHVDPDEFATKLRTSQARQAATAAYADALGLPVLRVDYRELLVEAPATFRRVFEHLGVTPIDVQGSTFKLTSDDLRASIENFDELRGRYAGTEYEAMFDEVLRT